MKTSDLVAPQRRCRAVDATAVFMHRGVAVVVQVTPCRHQ
jgi:hypothetical protein